MKTALCFTPDLSFFRPAVRTIASLVAQGDADAFDIFIVCEPADVPPGFEALEAGLRQRIHLIEVDFNAFDRGLAPKGRFSRAVFRRLFLDRILPEGYERLVAMDADMLVVRPGLARLAEIDLGGRPIAAAYDMIFLMDHKGGSLAREFQASRLALGLSLDTPYFNAGLMTIDRAAWRALALSERAVEALRTNPERFPFMEQDALNSLLNGNFAPLSPRFNFMGDFFLTGLEERLRPIVLHFVNDPKPWHYAQWRGEARFALDYANWFAASPWSEWGNFDAAQWAKHDSPAPTPVSRRFAASLSDFLLTQRFVDN